jgi:predicted MFS family arabinose efflux permease
MAGNVGIALGPLVTALLLLTFDWRIVTRLLVVPAIVAIGYALTAKFDETAAVSVDGGTTRSMSLSKFVADSRALFTVGFGLAMCIVMMNGLFYRGTLTFLPNVLGDFLPPVSEYVSVFEPGSPLAEEFDLSSYLYVGLLAIGIGGQYLGGRVSDRIRPTTGLAVVFGSLVAVAVIFIPAARAGLGPLLVVSAVLGFLLFALQPLYQATIAEYSPPDDRGLSYGYTYLTSFGVGAAGAAIAGYLLSVVSVDGTFLALAVFPALGAGFSLVLRRRGSEE